MSPLNHPEPRILRRLLLDEKVDLALSRDAFVSDCQINDVAANRLVEGLALLDAEPEEQRLSLMGAVEIGHGVPRAFFLARQVDDRLRYLAWDMKRDQSDVFHCLVQLSFSHRPTPLLGQPSSSQ